MKIFNLKSTPLTETELQTLNDAYTLIEEPGKEFIGLALIGDNTVVLIDLNKNNTIELAKEQALKNIDENMSKMPDFGSDHWDEKRLAWVNMDNGLIITLIPYLDEFANGTRMPFEPSIIGRFETQEACSHREVRAIAWWDDKREVKEK